MVMLENRPGQLNLTFIIRKGISLYVIDMAERKEAELAPAILQEFTLICCCSVAECPTLVTIWTVTHQAPLSMGFPRQKY